MLVAIADLHCGSSHAICSPDVELADKNICQLNKTQTWIWSCWQDFCGQIPEGSVGFVVGDLVQGINYKDGALVSTKWSDQILIARLALEPFIERCSEVHLFFGTEWHEFVGGQYLLGLYQLLEAKYGERVKEPVQELWYPFGDELIHFAHHRSVSNAPATKATPLVQSLNKMLFTVAPRDGVYPTVVVRGHGHDPGYWWSPYGLSIGLPGWQAKTALVWRTAPESVPVVGGMFLDEDENRKCRVIPKIYKPKSCLVSKKS